MSLNNNNQINNIEIKDSEIESLSKMLDYEFCDNSDILSIINIVYENRNISQYKLDYILQNERFSYVCSDDVDIIIIWFKNLGVLS